MAAQSRSEVVNGVQAPSCNPIVSDSPPPQFYLRGETTGGRTKTLISQDLNGVRTSSFMLKNTPSSGLFIQGKGGITQRLWNNLSPTERMVYKNYAVRDTERYEKEIKVYNERMMTTSSSN